MTVFQIGETAICSVEVRNEAGAFVDPADSMTVSIYKRDVYKETDTAMSNDGVGYWHYDYLTDEKGVFTVEYTAVDGTRVTKTRDSFKVV